MNTLLTLLSGTWSVVKFSPTLLYNLPKIIALSKMVIELFGSKQFQEVLIALGVFFGKIAPPAPTADSAGTIPANNEQEKQRRFFRLRNRLDVAGIMTDREAINIAEIHRLPTYSTEPSYWT
jgi:hypothetical protein